MSWNDCLYAYAKKYGGDYWGRMDQEWDGVLRMEYRGEPVLIRAVATGQSRYETVYTAYVSLQVTLERRYSCKMDPKSAMVQGVKTAWGQVKKLAPQVPFGEDYGYPELTAQRMISTTDKPFTKRVLSSLELRQSLLDLPKFGICVDPVAPDSQYHQIMSFGKLEVETFQDYNEVRTDYTPNISPEFEPGLDKLLQLAWTARQAVTAWRMDPPKL